MKILKINISKLDTSWSIRKVHTAGIEKIKSSIAKFGILEEFPIVVDENNVIIDGHYRAEACKELGINEIYAIKKTFDTEADRVKFAIRSNQCHSQKARN